MKRIVMIATMAGIFLSVTYPVRHPVRLVKHSARVVKVILW